MAQHAFDGSRRLIAIGLAVAVAYVIAADLGFRVAFVAEQITTVWAPTGISLAALLLWGPVLWPAIWIGAFAANAGSDAPLWTAAAVATGNTLEAVAAAWTLRRLPRFDPTLRRIRDVLAFIVVGAVLSTVLSATVGVVTLCAAAVQPWSRFAELWSDWWLGDALGALVVAPLILTIVRRASSSRRERVEAGLLVGGAVVATHVVFGEVFGPTSAHPLEYVIFPFVIAAAVRAGQPVTACVVCAASAVTIWNTVHGAGPFAGSGIHQSLILLQAFMGVLAGTGLLLAAAIAERKREETAVGEEQRRTSAILETALDAVIVMDHRGTITEFNPAAVRIFGYSREEALGRELAVLVIPPALRQQHREGLSRYLTTGAGPFIDRRVETIGYHADGHEFPVEVAITRVTDDGPPTFTGFVRDLTARVQAEREREQLLLREAAARREAESANRAKDEFLATLSHELRTPLNAIVGWTRMLLDGTMDGRSTRRALEVIDRNAHLQAKLVADLLDASRIITGGLRLDVRPVDLGTVIGAALDAVRPAADAKKVRLRSRLPASARLTHGDPQRLQQIVWNLLANAVKFTETGGVVSVDLIDAGARGIHIRVDDDGAGIDPAFLPHVFERFRQADGSVGRRHGGLGIGLAIVRHLVELHGGTVRADSLGTGRGSTFTVELPRLDPEATLTPSDDDGPGHGVTLSDARQRTVLTGYRVLVVDDEEDARELMAAILTAAGARVDTAASVADALQQLDVERPDALLADIGMPGADGYVLIREVRRRDAQQSARHLPAAAITAYAGERDRERAIAAGFDCHLPKPISRSAIVEAIVSICRDRRQAP